MACGDCFKLEKELQKQADVIFREAKAYALKHNTTVVAYKNEKDEIVFLEWEEAERKKITGHIILPI